MVLYKRKPVQLAPVAKDFRDNEEVWYIKQTGETFNSYDSYISRMEFYKQRKFNCEITGHSGLTFFEALESEHAGAAEVEQAFPEALKGPVLRRVQFQTVSRIDALVDQVYDEFKSDYHPGESVTAIMSDHSRRQGVVRDKTRYGSKVLADGTQTRPYTRYIVSLDAQQDKQDGKQDGKQDNSVDEAVLEESNIYRDRKVFTKSVLRSFIKKTVSRESWNGAPWLVRNEVAEQYHIDTRVPSNLLYNTKIQERKQLQAQKRQSQQGNDLSALLNSTPGSPDSVGLRLPELKPVKSHKAKHLQQQQRQVPSHDPKSNGASKPRHKGFAHHVEPGQFQHLPLPNNPFQNALSMRNHVLTPPGTLSAPAAPPVPPPPKYPIEDLRLEPSKATRPALRFLCSDPPVDVDAKSQPAVAQKILMKSVGPLLETWDTLNVYCEIFKLDSFTFDDFVEMLIVANNETPVQMFDEIHCAVLKTLVLSKSEGGHVQFALPDADSDSDEEEEEEEEEAPEPEPAPEPKRATRATRNSLAKAEAERVAAEAAAAEKVKEDEEPVLVHRAEDVLEDFDWIEELAKRNFKAGGWQMIMVGLLFQLSHDERRKASCEELLAQIVPPDVEATPETVQQHYAALDINHRVQALQIICMLTMETRAVRGYMEDCSEQMTKYRKEKIEWQRSKKQYVEELKALQDQHKILLPDNMPPSPPQEPEIVDGDSKMSDAEDLSLAGEDSDDELGAPSARRGRSLRRGDDRAAERKRKRDREQERKKEAEAAAKAAKAPKQSKQFLKLLRDIEKKEAEIKECEDEIETLDNDLREADCPRTRCLGKDRFWNRYYWFERNGMPFGGLPTSSTAGAEYANGCIWVQGPDEIERLGYIDMEPVYQKEYRDKFNMTVPERKKQEEGATSVYHATQWGYYAEPKDVEALIGWLDPRGFNEMKLRKELLAYRSKIALHMQKRKAYLSGGEAAAADDEDNEDNKDNKDNGDEDAESDVAKPNGTAKRMSTRTRTAPTPEPSPRALRCVEWHNSMAEEDLGHIHSEEPPPAKPRKQGRKKETPRESLEPPRKKTRSGR